MARRTPEATPVICPDMLLDALGDLMLPGQTGDLLIDARDGHHRQILVVPEGQLTVYINKNATISRVFPRSRHRQRG